MKNSKKRITFVFFLTFFLWCICVLSVIYFSFNYSFIPWVLATFTHTVFFIIAIIVIVLTKFIYHNEKMQWIVCAFLNPFFAIIMYVAIFNKRRIKINNNNEIYLEKVNSIAWGDTITSCHVVSSNEDMFKTYFELLLSAKSSVIISLNNNFNKNIINNIVEILNNHLKNDIKVIFISNNKRIKFDTFAPKTNLTNIVDFDNELCNNLLIVDGNKSIICVSNDIFSPIWIHVEGDIVNNITGNVIKLLLQYTKFNNAINIMNFFSKNNSDITNENKLDVMKNDSIFYYLSSLFNNANDSIVIYTNNVNMPKTFLNNLLQIKKNKIDISFFIANHSGNSHNITKKSYYTLVQNNINIYETSTSLDYTTIIIDKKTTLLFSKSLNIFMLNKNENFLFKINDEYLVNNIINILNENIYSYININIDIKHKKNKYMANGLWFWFDIFLSPFYN